MAKLVQEVMAPTPVILEEHEWGLDHGAWAVLKYMYPEADIPVVQLSLDATLTDEQHYELAKKLRPLREQGILIVASGNVVHNLMLMNRSGGKGSDWAHRFNDYFKEHLLDNHHQPLIHPLDMGVDAKMSIPTPEHYWPALYILAQQEEGDAVEIAFDPKYITDALKVILHDDHIGSHLTRRGQRIIEPRLSTYHQAAAQCQHST